MRKSIREISPIFEIGLIFTLLVSAWIRFRGLVGFGLEHDEVQNWLINRSIIDGNHAVYFTQAYGHEAGFHYFQTAGLLLLGDNALALRVPAAFLGIVLVAVVYRFCRALGQGKWAALVGMAVVGTTFFPVFYSRLGLRAISLPVVAGLGVVFFVKLVTAPERGGDTASRVRTIGAGLLMGLASYTYMASRALPIFFGVYLVYLAIFERGVFRRRWRGFLVFGVVYAAVSLPLIWFLQTNPGAEFRITEISRPLNELREGNLMPILRNSWQILLGFGVRGDPLWRQNVAGVAVFPWWLAIPFYGGVLLSLAKLFNAKERKTAVFVLLWLGCGVIPSVVTADAPSTIRMILIVLVLGYFVATFMHTLGQLSTEYPQLSPQLGKFSWITALTVLIFLNSIRSIELNSRWLASDEVAFVWQEAFFEMGRYLDASAHSAGSGQVGASVLGWSPDTLDEASLDLMMVRDDVDIRFFGHELAEEVNTVIVPVGGGPILMPSSREISPLLVGWLGEAILFDEFVVYEASNVVQPSALAVFNNELLLESVTKMCGRECEYVFAFRVLKEVGEPRSFFVHQTESDGIPLWQDDGLHAPTKFWREGDLILRSSSIPIDSDKDLRIGFYNPETSTRLSTDHSLDYFLVEQ